MWIVRVALDRPYPFIVLALLILIASPVLVLRTPTDIFPSIDTPVIAVAWQLTGLNPDEMEGRITTLCERVLTTTVDNRGHVATTMRKTIRRTLRAHGAPPIALLATVAGRTPS